MQQLSRVQQAYQAKPPASRPDSIPRDQAQANRADFAQTLAAAKATAQAAAEAAVPAQAQGISFSNHAQKRLQKREIQLDNDDVTRLADAVDKVEKRGGKSSLVLMDDLAFIVNVRERMVVTAMDTRERGEGVYNQIDSVVFAAPVDK